MKAEQWKLRVHKLSDNNVNRTMCCKPTVEVARFSTHWKDVNAICCLKRHPDYKPPASKERPQVQYDLETLVITAADVEDLLRFLEKHRLYFKAAIVRKLVLKERE